MKKQPIALAVAMAGVKFEYTAVANLLHFLKE